MSFYISNCGSNENGGIKGGQAGDQTGNEWRIRTYYKYPWTSVLRYPDVTCGNILAVLATAAALNDNVGYDQPTRKSFYNCLVKAGYNPGLITQKCAADCSAGVAALIIAVGHLCNESVLRGVSPDLTTAVMKTRLYDIGFHVYTGDMLTDPKMLLPGDILLAEGKHTCIFLGEGVIKEIPSVEVDKPVKVAYARSKDAQFNRYYTVIEKCALCTDAGGKEITELMPGTRVRCYGYHTGSWLLVQVVGEAQHGFIYRNHLGGCNK